MAYEKQTWRCGEVVTADKLNHMEDGIENATGFTCTEETTLLTDENVTTETSGSEAFAMVVLAYTTPITADTIRVTINGTEYECERQNLDDASAYGAHIDEVTGTADWSQYPFAIMSSSMMGNALATESASTYQIKIETLAETVETTECFRKAVNSIISDSAPLILTITERSATTEECPNGGRVTEYNYTWREVYDALASGRPCYAKRRDINSVILVPIVQAGTGGGLYIGTADGIDYMFTNNDSKEYIRCSDK